MSTDDARAVLSGVAVLVVALLVGLWAVLHPAPWSDLGKHQQRIERNDPPVHDVRV